MRLTNWWACENEDRVIDCGTKDRGEMGIEQRFLDIQQPALRGAVRFLLEKYARGSTADLRTVTVVVPGSRAGRRLMEVLVEEAERRELLLAPPLIETVGRLPEQLYQPKHPFASELTQRLAWTAALRGVSRATLAAAIPFPPAGDEPLAWLSLGDLLRRVHTELAADGLRFRDVAQRGTAVEGFDEAPRWLALQGVQDHYLRLLDGLELWDVQTARLVAIEKRECHTDHDIVLVGTVDMNVTLRRMLDQVSDRVTTLIFAPPQWRDRFDEHGCLLPDRWADVEIPLDDSQVTVADAPRDQADAVVRWLASLNGKYRPDEITIGVPDESLVSHLTRRLDEFEVPNRWGVGTSITESAPYRLLDAVQKFAVGWRYRPFAALARHPDLGAWLRRHDVAGDWLVQIDDHYNEHLPWSWSSADLSAPLKAITARIEQWLAPLAADEQPLSAWTDAITNVLLTIYGDVPLDRFGAERTTLAACEVLLDTLQQQAQLPGSLAPILSGPAALRLVLEQATRATIPARADRAAVELVGWLELPLDDSPALIVTNFNEGFVPDSVNSDIFLPNTIRSQLGLLDNARRYARDAYALSVLLGSREQLRLVVGRRNADAEPLAPSRLLFAAPGEVIARRALKFFRRPKELTTAIVPAKLANELAVSAATRRALEVPRPWTIPPITELSVTSFRDYLACPYRFFLSRVLRLEATDDDAEEMDGAAFGNVAHEVLRRFGLSPERESSDADRIRKLLFHELEQVGADKFGKSPRPAIALQIEQLRGRLSAFAEKQAVRCAEGWRIRMVEVSASARATLEVDGQPLRLKGRIDRIDQHATTGQWAVLDYKTADSGMPPGKTHLRSRAWVDLQLPLYRHLVREHDIPASVSLGYVVLPKDAKQTDFLFADWSDAELAAADETARNVVRGIRQQRFWPPTFPPPDFSEVFAAICQDGVLR